LFLFIFCYSTAVNSKPNSKNSKMSAKNVQQHYFASENRFLTQFSAEMPLATAAATLQMLGSRSGMAGTAWQKAETPMQLLLRTLKTGKNLKTLAASS
jgi:hypothetical protein